MDPLSVTASIIAVLQLSAKVLEYLNNVKDAPKDRAQCAIETSNLYNLLFNLRIRVEEGDSMKPWYTAVRALAVENRPLDQFKQALETLQTKITDRGRLKKIHVDDAEHYADDVVRWLSKAKATLFCPGILGAVAYGYCNYKAQKKQDATSILAAILKQLV
ncbi:hypothetical protein K469DRAFT_692605 [Zopfia rhizophila CBS 207.26]|uniref:Fungal N-terminal domain-containing protein n=1 Tax=Zopfia rhizophila CBS 207.26 TaxID=1314779 RepID=A0A6A6DRD0_9PEZI|nr:hypothetical protein K469DRAFT_692605 [Zopfia rhizophila CBS 207.26]